MTGINSPEDGHGISYKIGTFLEKGLIVLKLIKGLCDPEKIVNRSALEVVATANIIFPFPNKSSALNNNLGI